MTVLTITINFFYLYSYTLKTSKESIVILILSCSVNTSLHVTANSSLPQLMHNSEALPLGSLTDPNVPSKAKAPLATGNLPPLITSILIKKNQTKLSLVPFITTKFLRE